MANYLPAFNYGMVTFTAIIVEQNSINAFFMALLLVREDLNRQANSASGQTLHFLS
jgi:hypothetical protein